MKKLVIILMLLAFTTVTGGGCYGTGPCPHGVCNEEHSKSTGPPEKASE